MHTIAFYRTLVLLNGLVPALVLGWDAWQGQLGANPVNNALHITGILSLVFLFLSLTITPLRWLTQWGGWVAFRRMLGLYGFFYALAHVAIYVSLDRAMDLSSTLNEIWTRRFLQIGTLAILLMVPLAVTSTDFMVTALGPRRWKQLHRLSYLVVALGVVHYFLLVKSDVRQPVAFGIVLAALLGTRLGKTWLTPAPRTSLNTGRLSKAATKKPWSGELEVVALVRETPDVKTFRLMTPDRSPLPFTYLPGQYLNLQLEIEGQTVRRSYTIASSPTRTEACELTIKREPEGLVSRYLHDHVSVGSRLRVTAPAGRFTFTGDEAPAVLLIAGGVGITPLMSMVRALTDRAWTGDIYFLVIAKSRSDLIFHDEIESLRQRFPNLHVGTSLTRAETDAEWMGLRGRANAHLLETFAPNIRTLPVYLCGPNPMMDATRELLLEMGLTAKQIQTEAFVSPGVAGHPEMETTADALPEIAPAATSSSPSKPATRSTGLATVTFARSQAEATIAPDATVLDTAEAAGVDLPWECRSGICGTCKVRLLAGSVRMDAEDALSPTEKKQGLILACQAHAQGDITIDA
jgi:ferredoxin-NADP reductase/DMSO/TMAO reductase YedYZ heme-binding membrane subunit